jgi:hypothetical protein
MAEGMSGDQEFLADEVKIIMKDVFIFHIMHY